MLTRMRWRASGVSVWSLYLWTVWMMWMRVYASTIPVTNGAGDERMHLSGGAQLTESVNLARGEAVAAACESSGPLMPLQNHQLQHLLLDHKHKLLYCYVPKIACTNWKRIFMILSDKWNGTDVLAIPASLAHSAGMFPNLGDYSPEDREGILENYTKLIFVRHPFERVLSAYRNKLEDESPSAAYFQQRVGRTIIQHLRPHASNISIEKGNDVTFEEFVEYLTLPLTDSTDVPYAVNEHWESIVQLCHPCFVNYTIIGKYETLLDDSILALNTINASHIPFPRDIRTSGTADKLRQYYGSLPLDLIRRLYEVYKADFKLFNYNLQDILGFDLG
ncbi:carbohydrate sulfotransferase 11 [Arctopsyche grandis]|uniref:carbohydrate sulfotransferase 11 n=1 Tax=Arctopsyche grandis TaxID=121162 RepID=UPI00406DA0CE